MSSSVPCREVRAVFERINDGDYMSMVNGLAPSFEYRFHGDHALGGRRTTRESMIRWWKRVVALLPGARFDIGDVLVNGGPWRTRIAVRASISGNLPGDVRYENTVFQFMTLAWGRSSPSRPSKTSRCSNAPSPLSQSPAGPKLWQYRSPTRNCRCRSSPCVGGDTRPTGEGPGSAAGVGVAAGISAAPSRRPDTGWCR